MLQVGDILLIGAFRYTVHWVKNNHAAFLFKDSAGVDQVIVLKVKGVPQLKAA